MKFLVQRLDCTRKITALQWRGCLFGFKTWN